MTFFGRIQTIWSDPDLTKKVRIRTDPDPQHCPLDPSYLDWLAAQAGDALHGGERGLLLYLIAKADEPEPLARPRLVQDHWKQVGQVLDTTLSNQLYSLYCNRALPDDSQLYII